MLQQQMNVLADNQNHSDERYTRAKQENAALQARLVMAFHKMTRVSCANQSNSGKDRIAIENIIEIHFFDDVISFLKADFFIISYASLRVDNQFSVVIPTCRIRCSTT